MSDVQTYQATVIAALQAAKILRLHDIPKILRAIDHADSVGPLLDPTLWMQKGQAMKEDRKVLQAALPLWNLAKAMEVE